MRAMKIGMAAALAAVALAGCATIEDAPAGVYAVGTSYSVTLGREWSDASPMMARSTLSLVTTGPGAGSLVGGSSKVRLLTIDGPLLNRLYLSEAMAPGDYLVRPAAKERPTPTYRAKMSPSELVEFVSDSVAAMDYERVETSGLRPAKFDGADGLRFDLSAQTKAGLEMAGTAETALVGDKLYVMLYLAPKEHYFAAGLPEVEAIMGSAKRKT